MKKLLSILLALVMVMTFALPAMAAEEPTYDVQITSDIRVDEVYRTTGDGVYMWTEYGKFDAIVAGQELQNITVSQLRWAIYEAYGIDLTERFGLTNQEDEPWIVGQKYPVSIQFVQWVEDSNEPIVIVDLFATVLVHETEIESIAVEPITLYYGADNYKDIVIVTTYKDGTKEKQMGGYSCGWEWPTEIGTYTEKIYLNWGYEIPVTINVVPVPASGKCGENLNWAYDAATKTLTISGTGAMYEIAKDLDTFWEYDYSYEPEFWYCDAEHIVVEEGVTSLPNFAFGWLEQKTLQLPSTLKEIPQMWLTVSMNMESLVIPEGITSLTGWPFGSPGNSYGAMTDLYLPSTLAEMDIVTVLTAGINSRNGAQILETIYFAGTEAQWNAIERVRSGIMNNTDDEVYAMFAERFSEITVVCTDKEEEEEKEIPTSGKLGENVTWKYDAATGTITLSGTGAAYDIYNDATNEAANAWHEAYMELNPRHVVVEEGITKLSDAIFAYSVGVESLTLPTTLKELPALMFGWNGIPTEDGTLDGYIARTMSSIKIPEGITAFTDYPFYNCLGTVEYYLPSTLTKLNLDSLCWVANVRKNSDLDPSITIHFAGTEEQWKNITFVDSELTENYGTGLTDAELKELFATFTVLFEPKINVENGTATIPDSSVKIEEGKDVVIDVTETDKKAESVVIGSETVEKIADAKTSVEIKFPDAIVSFDKTAIGAVSQQAGNAAVTIVAKEVKEETLSDKQAAALKDQEVLVVLSLEAHAGQTKITNFGGGKVTVSVPFELPQGKKGENFYVAYVAADGTITPMPTTYANGMLSFETTHFSNYVVLDNTVNPKDGDNGFGLAVLLMFSAAAAVCTIKRKVF